MTKVDTASASGILPEPRDGEAENAGAVSTHMHDCLIYLSGPITAKHGFSVEQNVAAALSIYWACLRAGIPAFCPHLSAAFPTAFDIQYEIWMAYDLAVIDRCSHVLMLSRWETSSGACRELTYAMSKNLPVFYSLNGLLATLEDT